MTTYRVGPKGQVVVPKAIRDQIGLEPGHDVDVELVGDEIRIRRARPLKSSEFLGIWGPPEGMEGWAEEKRREIELEERKWKE
jgi:AbrB family looped-hinge helix DNA binding protein